MLCTLKGNGSLYAKNTKLIENSDTPIVSIVVLAYNHEHCITKCLQSILAQKPNTKLN